MSDPHLSTGRVNQKLRTRDALLDAAARLLAEGQEITVTAVADLANVGRTTGYRYFPNNEELLTQAALHAINTTNQRAMEEALAGSTDLHERLRIVYEASDRAIHDHKHLYRTMLRMSLGSERPRRSEIRGAVLDAALSGIKAELGPRRHEALTALLSLLLGIEGMVVFEDVCHIPRRRALDIKLWAADVLLDAMQQQAAEAMRPNKARPAKRRVKSA